MSAKRSSTFLWLAGAGLLVGCGVPAAHAQTAYPLPYTINTVAGGGTVCATSADAFGDGCPAKQAVFSTVLLGLGVDGQGNLYITDSQNNLIRRVDAKTGIVTVFAGSATSAVCAAALDKYGDGCPANDGLANVGGKYTYLGKPYALTVAKNGDVYFTGTTSIVQKVSAATGIMSVVAGFTAPAGKTGAAVSGYTGDGGPATAAEVNVPRGVGVSAANDVYIADFTNNVVRVVYGGGSAAAAQIVAANPGVTPVVGNIYTICGSKAATAGTTGDSGPASAALLTNPSDVAVDQYGNVFILDQSKEIRMIYAAGNVMGLASPVVGNLYRVAGGGTTKGNTLAAVLGTNVTMSTVRRVITDARGNLYLSDSNEIIWFLDATTGWMRPIAGVYKGSTLPLGCAQQTDTIGNNCPATEAQIHLGTEGYGLAVDANENLFITDASALTVREVYNDQIFPPASAAETQSVELHYPAGSTPGTIVSGNPDFTAGAAACTVNGDSTDDCVVPFTLTPTSPGIDSATITTVDSAAKTAKLGLSGAGLLPAFALDPGGATAFGAGLNKPTSVVSDGNGNLLIADTANHRVLKYSLAAGTQTVFAGTGTAGYTGDGGLATAATLKSPAAVAAAADGTVYIADTGNNVVRRVDPATALISTYAGGAATVCSLASDAVGDGCPGTGAVFATPAGLAVNAAGLLYVADTGNNRVRSVPLNGLAVLTVAGAGTVCATATDTFGDGCSALQATLNGPTQMALDAAGNLTFADTGNNLVRRVTLNSAGQPITALAGNGQKGSGGDGGAATSAQLSAPAGIALDAAGSVYIADSGNDAVRLVNSATGTINTIAGFNGIAGSGTVPGTATATLLSAPAGVAVTGTGMLFALDTGNSRALAIARNNLSFNFGKINTGQSSAAQPITVLSTGAVPASLGSPLVTGTGNTAELTLVPATTNGCSAAQAIAPGGTCSLTAKLSPTTNGTKSATYTFAGSTGVNSPVPSVTLSGTAGTLITTTTVATQTTPATGNPQYGQAVVVTATVTPASQGAAQPGGTVSFQVDSVTQSPSAVTDNAQGNGVATVTLTTLAVGTHTVTATYGGDGIYGNSSTTTALTLTVVKAGTAVSVIAAPTTVNQFGSVTFTATVTSLTSGVPTGTVTFVDADNGNAVIGSGAVNASGVAVFTSATLAVGTYGVVAQYGGNGNYAPSSSAPPLTFVVSPDPQDYTLTGSSTLSVAQGGTAQATFTLTPTNTLVGTVKMSCTGLPANSYCTFLPQYLPFTVATDQATTTQITVWTNITPGTVPAQAALRSHRETLWFALLTPLSLLALRRRNRMRWAGLPMLVFCSAAIFTGCSASTTTTAAVTPAGTSTVTVTAAGPNGLSHSMPLAVTVVAN